MTSKQCKMIVLFTYVNAGDGYAKQPITLFELLARLSDKNADVARGSDKIVTQPSDDVALATSEPTQGTHGKTTTI